MSRALAAIVVTVVAVLAALAPAAAPAAPLASETLTLRLPDLGPGYVVSDEDGVLCVPYELSGLRGRPVHRGCDIAFQRVWRAPGSAVGPAFVTSDAYVFDDAAALSSAFTRPRALAGAVFGAPRKLFRPIALNPPPLIGDATVVLRGDTGAVIVLWRSGLVLAAVLTADRAVATPAIALRLAAAQQARIAAPAPLAPADLDDLEVPLDDPQIAGPVYWLGRELSASGRFPRLPLADVEQPRALHRHGPCRPPLRPRDDLHRRGPLPALRRHVRAGAAPRRPRNGHSGGLPSLPRPGQPLSDACGPEGARAYAASATAGRPLAPVPTQRRRQQLQRRQPRPRLQPPAHDRVTRVDTP